jgi:hypothetical protein
MKKRGRLALLIIAPKGPTLLAAERRDIAKCHDGADRRNDFYRPSENKSVVLETLAKQFRMTDSAAAEGAYQDVATPVRLEEGRKPYLSLEGMRILQRLLKPQNPKIGEIKVESLIDSTIMKRIDDSGFFERLNAEYGAK